MMRSRARLIPALLGTGLTLLNAADGRARPPQAQTPPSFRTGIDLVVIDVTVVGSDGAPAEGLGEEDFAVTVDGSPRRISSFRFVRAPARPATAAVEPTTPAPANRTPAATADSTGRTFIIVVDREALPRGGGRSHLAAAVRFVDTLGSDDRVGLWTLPVVPTTLRFLHDREQLKQQLLSAVGTRSPGTADGADPGSAVGMPFARSSSRCLVLTSEEAYRIERLNDGAVTRDVTARECAKSCAPGEGCPQQLALQARLQTEANELALAALGHLLEALAGIPGPKHVILVTGGHYSLDAVRDLGQTAAQARIHVHALQVWDPLGAMDVEVAGSTSLPVFDQGGSAEASLANVTGGIVVTSPQGEAGFQRIARELAAWYVLAVEAGPADRDGKPHAIRVTVPGRRGLSVRARQQFIIPTGPARPDTARLGTPSSDAVREPSGPPDAGATPAVLTTPPPAGVVPGQVRLEELLARFSAEVVRFEREFSGMVAEERYVQLVHPWRGNPKRPEAEKSLEWVEPGVTPSSSGPVIARRQLRSDVLLVTIPNGRWVGYRDVAEVDGKGVRNRQERVRELFLSKAADRDEQLLRVAEESARYNLGSFKRNLNVPTIPLFLLHPRNHARFEFSLASPETIDGTGAAVVRYRERMRPTLIGTRAGRDVFAEGRVWLDPASGRVLQTELRFEPTSQRRAGIVTRYRVPEGQTVAVPDFMWEWYEGSDIEGRNLGDKVVTECLARYSNYRRFQVETSEQVRP